MKIHKHVLIYSESKSIKHAIDLSVESKHKIPLNRLELDSLLKQILNQELQSADIKDKKAIKVIIKKDNSVTYTINNGKSAISLTDKEIKLPNDLIIKTMSSATSALPKRFRTPAEIRRHLLENHPVSKPFIRFIWNLVTFPLCVLLFSFKPRVYDTSGLKKIGLVNDQKTLLTALKWSQKALKLDAQDDPYAHFGQEFSLDAQFDEAYKIGTKWPKSANKSKLSHEYAATILKRLKTLQGKPEAKGRATNLMMIPTGYWKEDKTYQPVLWSFYVNDQGKLSLSEMTYNDGTENIARDYTWNDEINSETLGKFMDSILALSTERKPSTPDSQAVIGYAAVKILDRSASPFPAVVKKDLASPTSTSILSMSPEKFRERALLSSGASITDRSNLRRTAVRENPWKLVHETLRLQFPEADASDKISFTFSILNDRMAKIIKALPDMQTKEKTHWLHQLTKEKESFERHLKKATLSDDAFSLFLKKDGAFGDFAKKVKQVELEIEKLDKASSQTADKRLAGLDTVKKSKFTLRLPNEIKNTINQLIKAGKTKKSNPTQLNSTEMTAVDRQLLTQIKQAFADPKEVNAPSILKTLDAIKERMNALNEIGAYQASTQLYNQAIAHFPPPNCHKIEGQSTYWDSVKATADQANNTSIFSDTSSTLTQLMEYFWEAKLKLRAPDLASNEQVHHAGVLVALHHLYDMRKAWVTDKPMSALSYDDYIIQGLNTYPSRSAIGESLKLIFQNFQHLPAVNPVVNDKLDLLTTYLIDRNNAATAYNEKNRNIEEHTYEELKAMTKRWADYNKQPDPNYDHAPIENYKGGFIDFHPFDKSGQYTQYKNILSSYLSKDASTTKEKATAPSQLIDLHHYEFMTGHLGASGDKAQKAVERNKRIALDTPQKIDYQGLELGYEGYDGFGSTIECGPNAYASKTWFSKFSFYHLSEHSRDKWRINQKPATDNYIEPREINSEDTKLQNAMAIEGNPFDLWRFETEQLINKDWIKSTIEKDKDPRYAMFMRDQWKVFQSNSSAADKRTKSYELFSCKNIEEVFDIALQSFDLYDDENNQIRHYYTCNRPLIAQRLLRENPEYFIRRGPELRKAIDQAIKQGKKNRAIFLATLSSCIVKQAEFALNSLREPFNSLKADKDLLRQVIHNMPTLVDAGLINDKGEKQPRHLIDLMASMLPSLNIPVTDRLDYASNILGFYAIDRCALFPNQMEELKNDPMAISVALASLNLLEIGSHACTLEEQASAGRRWAKEVLLPSLIEGELCQDDETLFNIFDRWVSLEEGVSPQKGSWKRDENTPHLYIKGEITIDLTAHKITREGYAKQGLITPLPKEVIQNKSYTLIFGKNTFQATSSIGSKSGEVVFTFVDHNGTNTRITYDKSANKIEIDQEFNVVNKRGETPEWHRFTLPDDQPQQKGVFSSLKSFVITLYGKYRDFKGNPIPKEKPPEPRGIETVIIKNGMWMNLSNPLKGKAFLEASSTQKRSSQLDLTFNSSNLLVKVKSATGQSLNSDEGDRLLKILNPIGDKHIAFFSHRSADYIDEIHLIDQSITLKRSSPKAPWIVASGPYKDYEWVMGAKMKSATTPFSSLGVNVEETGLVLKSPKSVESKLLLWPQQITSTHTHHQGPSDRLDFKRREVPGEPLVMTLDEFSTLDGCSEGFLYLAYLCAAKHDYQLSLHYLKQAENKPIQNENDFRHFNTILEGFNKLPGSSMRLNAIKLKAQLTGYKIIRQQTEPQTAATDKKTALKKNKAHLVDLLAKNFSLDGKPPLRNINPAALKTFLEVNLRELTLTVDDLDEIKNLLGVDTSLLELANKALSASKNLQSTAAHEKGVWAWVGEGISPEALEFLPTTLLTTMASRWKTGASYLKELPHTSPEAILPHFFHLWNEIIDKKVKPSDLLPLFGPVPPPIDLEKALKQQLETAATNQGERPKTGDTPANPNEINDLLGDDPEITGLKIVNYAQINAARKLLLALAEKNVSGTANPAKKFNLKQLAKTQSKISTGLLGFTGTVIGSWFASKPYQKSENLKEMIKQIGLRTALGTWYAIKDRHIKATLAVINSHLSAVFTPGQPVVTYEADPTRKPKAESELQLRTPPKIDPIPHLVNNLLSDQYKTEILPQIKALEAKFTKPAPKALWPKQDPAGIYKRESLTLLNFESAKHLVPVQEASSVMTSDKLDAAKSALVQFFKRDGEDTSTKEPIEIHENALLCTGIDKIAGKLSALIDTQSKSLNLDTLEELRATIFAHLDLVSASNSKLKQSILDAIKASDPKQLPVSIRWLAANSSKTGDAALFDALLNCYQEMEPGLAESVQKDLLQFLIHQTEYQMLQVHGQKALELLQTLKDQKSQLTTAADHTAWQQEWNLASFDLQKVIATATNRLRYLNSTGHLQSPRFTRKYLVAELRHAVILSQEQVRIIESMVKDPSNWYELRMGLGKTSFIFPIVLMLIAEEGLLPVGLVKSQLLNQNAESLDKTTRLLLNQAAAKFSFDINQKLSFTSLADQYSRLLKAKEEKGYLITTVRTVASIEHKLILLRHEFNHTLGISLPKDSTGGSNQFKTAFNELKADQLNKLEEIQKTTYWLAKIRSLLKADQTQLIGDEIDDLFNPTFEDNLALGEPVELNSYICNAIHLVNRVIQESANPFISRLKQALVNQEQAAIRPKEMREKILPALFHEIWSHPAFKAALGCTDQSVDLNQLISQVSSEAVVAYICNQGINPIDLDKFPKNSRLIVQSMTGALKHLNATLPLSLVQDPNIDIGIKTSDGFTVGPQVSGEEKEGMLYGDEYDVIVNHYMTYAFTLPDTPFIQREILKFQERNPIDFEPILEKSKQLGFPNVFTFLKHPDSWKERLTLLRVRIIDERMIKRYDEQHVFNVQESVFDTNIGGMSGTMNPYLFPLRKNILDTACKDMKEGYIPRSVEAETFLRIGCMNDPKVDVATEKEMLGKMCAFLSNPECKAIINEGSSLNRKNAYEAVQAFRTSKEGKARTYIFIDPTTRKPHVWLPSIDQPAPINKKALNDLLLKNPEFRANCLFYFGPVDTRGTDFKIPPGFGVVVTGPTTNTPNWMQAVWRLRGLGQQHTCRFIIPKAVQERIIEEQKITADQLNWKHLVNDLKSQTLATQQGINVKATKLKITSPLKRATRDLLAEFCGGLEESLQADKALFDATLYETVHKLALLIVPKRVDLELDFNETKMLDIEEQLKSFFVQEFGKITQFKEALEQLKALQSGPAQANQIEGILKKLDETKANLSAIQTDVENNIHEHKKHLPSRVPSNGGGEASSQEQVQEQAQQQEQQQQQEQNNITPVRFQKDGEPYIDWNPITLEMDDPNKMEMVLPIDGFIGGTIDKTSLNYIYSSNIYQSKNFSHLYKTWQKGRLKGDPLGRILVVGQRAVLITHSDYHYDVNKYLRLDRGLKLSIPKGVYTLVNGAIDEKGFILNDSGHIAPDLKNNPELRKQFVKMKWYLGYYQYSKQELADLKEWFQSVETALIQIFTEEYSVPQQLELFHKLVKDSG